ncbi:DUF1653 domain-containing protein [Kangiella koreensis]|uniref:DUF1653 domain-containing protein n=1 Tax=Kangiella koreensis (strain DSM 16069 / JCM 12317 / KCTC 12182 / SW-125) TaxID=523791 RepID=C7R8T2_KANKD|nr:DUF1653 domain-containing protein [Kangiella koreensis]ACV25945.1 protein of unknown function DUF1653 [Kangiella koreensis DSM 16069]
MSKDLPKGTYKHYKGKLYEVLDVARHSETLAYFVVYKTLYGDFDTWIRPLEMFTESIEVDGVKVKRFQSVEEK